MPIKEVQAKAAERKPRTVSAIGYPYFDHDASIKVPEVIQREAGGTCAADFLASKLEYASVKSGTFLTRMAAARMFGYISTSGGNFVVTERARMILEPVMPGDKIEACVDGFMSVPLFRRAYDEFHGKQLPQEIGLRHLFVNTYGIIPERAQQAVRVFLNSAEQCGFFAAGKNRLIRPASSQRIMESSAEAAAAPGTGAAAADTPSADKPRVAGGGGGDGGGIHTALLGLLRELPKPGQSWSESEQKGFIDAFTGLVKFIFPASKKVEGQE